MKRIKLSEIKTQKDDPIQVGRPELALHMKKKKKNNFLWSVFCRSRGSLSESNEVQKAG